MPAIGSVPVSTLSRFSNHMIPDVAQEILTIVNRQTAGANSLFKYLSNFRNSEISCNEKYQYEYNYETNVEYK